jgi:hypothetical protein
MFYTARIPGAVASVPGVSPQDAAIKAATRWASVGLTPHGVTISVAVFRRLFDGEYLATPVVVEVTPQGRTWGSIVDQCETVAA